MRSPVIRSLIALSALLIAAPAFADEAVVGKISVLEGEGTRTDEAGASTALAAGLPIRVKDTLALTKGRLKIVLNDESVVALAVADKGEKRAELKIDEASFKDQVREGFFASLGVGKFWAKVKKAVGGSEAKFEVKTERAVAGVRGTIFRVDAVSLVKASKPSKKTTVWVTTGAVGVDSTGNVKTAAAKKGGPRQQVAGPQEVTKAQWEKQFALLQKGMAVTVDEELWTVKAMPIPKDDLAAFVKNDNAE